ncbi:restriction endonuclease subunit S [Streptomyces sp. NPDC085927]|uniref:restriction endonuclease subunit S n=1 Tax=Streptomyces sp. NPDC085927 TaxID=3365738 RepID=UPI0037D60C10
MGSDLTKLRHFSFDANALVLSNIKAWEGAIAVTSEEDVKAVASSRFLFYVPQRDDVEIRYLRYYFLSARGLAQIGQASPGSADRNRTLSMKSFENIVAPLPDLAEQRRVADKLDDAMNRIARVGNMKNASTSLTLQHADALFRSIEQAAPLAKALLADNKFIDVEPDSTYLITGIYSFGRGLIKRPAIQGSDTAYTRFAQIQAGQIVMSKLNAWEGALAVVSDDFADTYVSPEYPVFSLIEDAVDSEYMEHLLAWPELWAKLTPRGSMVRRKRTTPATLLATEVPLPSLSEQRRIAKQLTLARRVADGGAAQVEQLATLRRTLLDAAFSGRL